ncbi:MAG TPA: hypothetical protein VGG39_23510 [Polyangiaceae bacterium]
MKLSLYAPAYLHSLRAGEFEPDDDAGPTADASGVRLTLRGESISTPSPVDVDSFRRGEETGTIAR